MNESIDEIAEHILILGGQPLGTLKDYLAVSTIQEGENKKLKSDEIYNNLITDYEKLLKKSTEIKEEADKQNDYATSALIDDYILSYGKHLWMLRHLLA